MTREQAIKALSDLDDDDNEKAHQEADALLLDVLREHGCADVAEAFVAARKRIHFFYA